MTEQLKLRETLNPKEEPERTWLIFGAGSPQANFKGSRFNIGAAAVDLLADINSVQMRETGPIVYGSAQRGNAILKLSKPNIIPEMIDDALLLLKKGSQYDRHSVILIYGDDAFEPGSVKIKHKGGQAGNKVLESFLQIFGRKDVVRIRIGIGKNTEDWKSGTPPEIQEKSFPLVMRGLSVAAAVVHELVANGPTAANEMAAKANSGKSLV